MSKDISSSMSEVAIYYEVQGTQRSVKLKYIKSTCVYIYISYV